MSYTPEPWRVESRGGMLGREVHAGLTCVVATVNTTSNTEGNRLANARLIAAAPELLASLAEMVEKYDPDDGYTTDVIERARAAIRKATEAA